MAPSRNTRSRFFVDPSCIDRAAGLARCNEPGLSHQVRNVLRLQKGDQVQLLDGLGHLWEARLASADRTFIEFLLESEITGSQAKAPLFSLISCLPMIKAQRFEWALEKLCELGVSQILPFQSDRCMVKLKSTEAGRSKRWLAICKEASEQCERLSLPELHEPLSLTDLLKKHAQPVKDRAQPGAHANHQGQDLSPPGSAVKIKMVLSERNAEAPDMVSTLYNLALSTTETNRPLDVLVLSGPEGGFSDEEQRSIAAHDFCPVSLGDLILRSETACILAAGLVSAVSDSQIKKE